MQKVVWSSFLILAGAGLAWAQDTDVVVLHKGKSINEKVTKESPTEVEAGREKVPVQNIKEIRYHFPNVRTRADFGSLIAKADQAIDADEKLIEALTELKKAVPGTHEFAQMAVDYAIFQVRARMAMIDPKKVGDAEKLMERFKNTRHWYGSRELMAQVYTQAKEHEKMTAMLEEYRKSNFPGAGVKADVYIGVSAMKNNKLEDAIKMFESAVKSTDDAAPGQKRLAKMYLADAFNKAGRPEEGKKLIDDVLKEITDDESDEGREVKAVAFNVLGDILKAQRKTRLAMYDGYMQVDMRCNRNPEQHARALYNIVVILDELKDAKNAKSYREKLKSLYPNSTWSAALK